MVGRQTYSREVASSIVSLVRQHNDSGQVVHTHVHLLPSSTIRYWQKLGRKQTPRDALVLCPRSHSPS